jgi:uncharacterized protein (DUF2236 family)
VQRVAASETHPDLAEAHKTDARLLTTQWLPERLCREYGLKISNFDRAMYHYIMGYISMVYPHLPRKARTSLSRYYMKDLKKAVKEVQTIGV